MRHFGSFPGSRFFAGTLIFFVCLIAGFLLATALWDFITVPYSGNHGIPGVLLQERFHPATNWIRVLVYISLPAVIWILGLTWFSFITQGFPTKLPDHPWSRKMLRWVFLFAFLWALVKTAFFFVVSWTPEAVDPFHIGEVVSPAFRAAQDGSLWTGTFFTHGFMFDIGNTLLGWWLLGKQTVGAALIALEAQNSLVHFSLIFFLLALAIATHRWGGGLQGALVFSLCLVFYIHSAKFHYLERRDIPLLVSHAFLLLGLATRSRFWVLIAGAGHWATFFYSIDRAAYAFASGVLAIIAELVISNPEKRKSLFVPWATGVVCAVAGSFFIWGSEEMGAFFTTTLKLFQYKDYLDALVYRHPTRWTNKYLIPAVLLGTQILTFAMMLPAYLRDKAYRICALHLFMVSLALFYFRSAMGRSDEFHVRYASTFIFLGLGFTLTRLLSSVSYRAQLVAVTLGIVYVGSHAVLSASDLALRKSAILSFPERVGAFLNAPDTAFYEAKQSQTIAQLKSVFAREPCLFSLSNYAILPFFLKKPACGRFLIPWFASFPGGEEEFLKTLGEHNPRLIVYEGPIPGMDGYTSAERLPNLMRVIHEKYEPFTRIGRWSLWRRKGDSFSPMASLSESYRP